jgi:hypothetical protein
MSRACGTHNGGNKGVQNFGRRDQQKKIVWRDCQRRGSDMKLVPRDTGSKITD